VYYVYLLESAGNNRQHYTGFTADLKQRLATHNAGENPSTAAFRPWNLIGYIALAGEAQARAFERYLKSGSGKTFSKRHFR
jgi:putative endonuclease